MSNPIPAGTAAALMRNPEKLRILGGAQTRPATDRAGSHRGAS